MNAGKEGGFYRRRSQERAWQRKRGKAKRTGRDLGVEKDGRAERERSQGGELRPRKINRGTDAAGTLVHGQGEGVRGRAAGHNSFVKKAATGINGDERGGRTNGKEEQRVSLRIN